MKNISRPFVALGQRIKALRKKEGWPSAVEFAEHAGVAVSSLRDIERGVAEGEASTRSAIAKALNRSVEDLYNDGSKGEPVDQLKSAARVLEALASASDETQHLVLALLDIDRSFHIRQLSTKQRELFQKLLIASE